MGIFLFDFIPNKQDQEQNLVEWNNSYAWSKRRYCRGLSSEFTSSK